MGNRRFERYEYRDVLVRMRLGETDRALAKPGRMGQRKAAHLRATAVARGWLEGPLPGDAILAEVFRSGPALHPLQSQRPAPGTW